MFSPIKRLSLNLACLQLKAFFDDKHTLLMQNAVIFLTRRLSAVATKFVILHHSADQKSRAMRVRILHATLAAITLVGWLLRRHHLVFQKRLHFIFPRISDNGFQNFENFGSTRSWKLSNRDFWQNRKHHPPGGPFCFVK